MKQGKRERARKEQSTKGATRGCKEEQMEEGMNGEKEESSGKRNGEIKI